MINKRLLILISIILVIIIIAIFSLWFLFKQPETQLVTEQPIDQEIVSTPIAPPQEADFKIFKLSDIAVISPVISGNKIFYYSAENGLVYETDFEGKSPRQVTNIAIPNLITSIWSYDRSKTISVYEENNEIKKVSFDFNTQKAIKLNSGIGFTNFSPNTDKIIYQFIDDRLGINKISTADYNDTNWQTVFNIRMANVRVYWPSENLITITTAPSGLVKGSALIKKIDEPLSGLTKIINDAYGLTIKYSQDGSRLIYSQTDQYGHNPFVYLLKDDYSSENLNIPTLSDKCSFSSNNNLYCAVPNIINGSLVLPDDFYKNLANFSDTFKKVDLQTNRTSTIFNPKDFSYDFNASELQISNQEDYIVFVNKKDGLLYSIKIK